MHQLTQLRNFASVDIVIAGHHHHVRFLAADGFRQAVQPCSGPSVFFRPSRERYVTGYDHPIRFWKSCTRQHFSSVFDQTLLDIVVNKHSRALLLPKVNVRHMHVR